MTMSVIFRCDASPVIGGGHVMRCMTLADALKERGWDCTFVTLKSSVSIVPKLALGDHNIVEINQTDARSPEPILQLGPVNLVIIDHYDLDATFETSCRLYAERVMAFDDIPGRRHDCDVLLDQTLGRLPQDYTVLMANDNTMMLTGSGFSLLRPEFLAARISRRQKKRKGSNRIFISFGAADPDGLCIPATIAALVAGADSVDIAVGQACPHIQSIRKLADANPKVALYTNAQMASLMTNCDLAIGAAGSTAWERCCLGLPALMVVTADNQKHIASALEQSGAARVVKISKTEPHKEFQTAISELLNTPERLMEMAKTAYRHCDGLGVDRVAAVLGQMALNKDQKVMLRPVEFEDADLLFQWQTDPETRRYFRNPANMTFEDHIEWLSRRLDDDDTIFHVISVLNTPVGSVRLDKTSDEYSELLSYEISIVVAPQHHGKGYGRITLALIREMLPHVCFKAEVNENNQASVALFCSAGYEEIKPGIFHSKPTGDTNYQQHGYSVSQ